jgi:hypothetical protein
MDEYTMSWSDATRAESSYSSLAAVPPVADVRPFGTLGRALWLERVYAQLRLQSLERAEQARHSTDPLAT